MKGFDGQKFITTEGKVVLITESAILMVEEIGGFLRLHLFNGKIVDVKPPDDEPKQT